MSKRKFFILILFSLLLSFVTIKGQIIPWQATQSSGMNIQAMASLSDVIIAGAYGDGIYFSFNDGIDWIQRNNGITNLGILSLVVKEQFIFTGTNGGGIYRSNNVGQDWAATNSGLSNLIVKSLLVFGERIFAGTDGGLFVSTNSGDNWVASGAGLEGNSIGSLAHNNQKIYAGTENGIFVSTDLGASWSESGLSGKNIRTISAQNEIIYAGAAGEGVYFSSDFGQNWLQINNGLTNGYIFSLLLDDDRVFAGSEGTGIFTGKLHENYWTSINSGLASLYVRSFLKYQDKIYAGTNDGIYFIPRQTFGTIQLITPNGGEIWYPGNINRIEWEAEELNLITIELSINNGTSWVVIAENVSADSGFYNWIIPKVSSDSCLLRLSADFYPSIYTISESNFAIQNTFTEIASFFTSAQLNANWGDYDNDGLMDIAISGSTDQGIVTKIIKNLGSGNFEERINLFGIFGRNYWGDFDNDNDLDLLVSGGTGGSNYTKLFRNNGDDSFTEISTNFPNIDGFCNWGDSDNDGDLDLVVTGLGILTARLYINNSDGTFSMQTLEMPTSQCKSKWADCDRDGDLDLIFYDGGQFKIFTNGGNNYFSGGSHYNIGSMWYGDLDIGDYNNDGNLDFLIVGGVGQNTAKVYRNNGNWTFTNTFTGHGVESSSADWGDYNNDGYLDFVISGTDDNDTERTKLYSNLNGQTFVEDTSFIFPGASQGSVRWADYDNDGDLDLLLCGTGIGLKIYRNNSVIKNTLPTQCTDLTFQAQTDGVQLSWTSGNDAQTPTNGLNYNLVIGSSSGEYDIMSPMADLGTGKRMLREIGNSLTSSWKIEGIDPGIYYWSVQTIDGSLEAAEFAPEQIFSFDVPYIHLLTPNGGETWRAGEQHDIKWLSESVSNVKLDFTTDNGSTWTNIATGLNAISGTFQWTVPSVNSDKVAVRITDEDFTNTTDESDSSFTIINPILMLIAPNGGEVWRAGENKVITWNAENISTLRIEYSTDSGNQWELISAGIQAQQGEYHWIIPDGYSINCLVKISDENIPEVYDSSDTTFAIMPAISQNYSIAFNEQNNEYIDGMTEERIQGNNPFTIEFWIKISQTNFQPIINRGSNSSSWVYNFYIQGNIYFGIRTEQNRYINCPISVAVWHHVAGVRSQDGNLKLFIDGVFQTENFIGQESLVYSDAQLRFAKYLDPDFHPNFKLSKIRISSTARYNENFIPSIYYTKDENTIGLWNFHEGTGNILVDESGNGIHGMISGNPLWDTDVPIVPYLNLTSPNGGENWRSGELQNITWTADNISTIKLEYTTNDETNWTSITTGQTASNGTFAWTVPTINSTTVKIKVSDEVFPHSSDESDAEFTIHGPTLTLTAPNGNETWLAGEVRDIKWTSDNISTVKLEYTTNNGINWTGITAGHTASTGTYAWTVPSINKTNVKVKVTDEVFPNISDESDGSFTIQFPPLTLTAPNGGETWRAGELRDITWTASNISTVKLEYTTNNGTNWTNIVTGQSAATGTYAWTVPNISSTTVKLKVTDEVFPNISDESNANFVIVLPSLTLKSPNGDEIMPAGSQFLINWDAEYLDFFIIEFTSDGGVTWQILSEGYFNVAYYNWVVPDISSLNCKVRIRAQNLPHYSDESDYPFTIENGLNWTKLPTDFNFLFSDVKFISADTGWVVGEFGKILHTTDGGDSWVDQLSGTDFHLRSVDFTSSKIGYILAIDNDYEGNILLKTVDGGLHWLDINSFHGTRYWSLCFTNSSTGFILGENGTILKSSDGGITWHSKVSGTNKDLRKGYFLTDSIGIVVGSQGALTKTVDAGENWSQFAAPYPEQGDITSAILINENIGFAARSSGDIIYSTNGGHNWWKQQSGNSKALFDIDFVSAEIGWAVGVSGVILKTVTGGSSWVKQLSGAGDLVLVSSDFPASFVGYAVGENGTIIKYIEPGVSIISPKGGEVLYSGSSLNISWIASLSTLINIDYSTNNGINWTSIVSNISSSERSFIWILPYINSSSCKIRITTDDGLFIYDLNIKPFSIQIPPGQISLNSPNGGEVWRAGESRNISWTAENVSTVKLEYTTNSGSDWQIIGTGIQASAQTFTWVLPDINSSSVIVRISDEDYPGIYDQSEALFSILRPVLTLHQPNGNETYSSGSIQKIIWSSVNIAKIKIEFSQNGGISWVTFADSVQSSIQNYNWTVNPVHTNEALIRVSDISLPSVADKSDSAFNIIHSAITLNSPSAGNIWRAGEQRRISWSASNVNTIKLEYSTDAGSNWELIISGLVASAGNYYWNIPQISANSVTLRAADEEHPDVFSAAENSIQIVIPSITLSEPGQDDIYRSGTAQLIRWSHYFADTVNLHYSTDEGASWIEIATNIVSPLSNHTWIIPEVNSNLMKVKISDKSIVDLYRISPAFSVFNPALSLISPYGSETIRGGRTFDITWTSDFVDKINLYFSTDSGAEWNQIAYDIAASQVKYSWQVPASTQQNCRILLSESGYPENADTSVSDFMIFVPGIQLINPAAGVKFRNGDIKVIAWSSEFVQGVDIMFSSNNGEAWTLLAQNYESSAKQYSWTIPDQGSANCKIRIVSSEYPDVYSESDLFEIFIYQQSIPVINSVSFNSSGDKTSYRMLGLPGADAIGVKELFSGTQGTDWQVFHDKGTDTDYLQKYDGSAVFTFGQGKAFWVLSKKSVSINDSSNTVALMSDNTYNLQLHSGWNIITNPFNRQILWSDVQSVNIASLQPIYDYQGSFSQSVIFAPFKGYYLYNPANLSSIKIPYVIDPQNLLKKILKKTKHTGFTLDLIRQNSLINSIAAGFAEFCSRGIDSLDIFAPPQDFASDGMTIYNTSLETGYKFLLEDHRPETGTGQEYELRLRLTRGSEYQIQVGSYDLPEEYLILLYDKRLKKPYDLGKEMPVRIKALHEENHYLLLAGNSDFIEKFKASISPAEFMLFNNYPNPFNPETVIRFSVPEKGMVNLSVYNILGEKVSTIINSVEFDSGYHELLFDGRGLASGVYIYSLTWKDKQSVKKMTLMK